MKKVIIFVISLFIFTSCFNSSRFVNNKNIEKENNTTGTINNKNIEESKYIKENFLKQKVPDYYKPKELGLLTFYNIILGKEENVEDKEYYNILRLIIFGDDVENKYKQLNDCLDGKIKFEFLEDNELKKICEGENKYIKLSDNNYFENKDFLLTLKEIKNGKGECEHFLNVKYDIDYNYIANNNKENYFNGDDVKLYDKLNKYLICKKTENIQGYDLLKNIFLYHQALKIKKCNYLDDINLTKLCNEKIQIIENSQK